MKRTYTIYKILCKPTWMEYIGYTGVDPEIRFSRHFQTAKKKFNEHKKLTRFQKILICYKREDFSLTILHSNIRDKNTADMLEMYYIYKFNTLKHGYNMTIGGDGVYIIDFDDRVKMLSLLRNGLSIKEIAGRFHKSFFDTLKCIDANEKYGRLEHILEVYRRDLTYDNYTFNEDKKLDQSTREDNRGIEIKV